MLVLLHRVPTDRAEQFRARQVRKAATWLLLLAGWARLYQRWRDTATGRPFIDRSFGGLIVLLDQSDVRATHGSLRRREGEAVQPLAPSRNCHRWSSTVHSAVPLICSLEVHCCSN